MLQICVNLLIAVAAGEETGKTHVNAGTPDKTSATHAGFVRGSSSGHAGGNSLPLVINPAIGRIQTLKLSAGNVDVECSAVKEELQNYSRSNSV